MKTWMKIAMWLGLGGGIGFFAGYRVGVRGSNQASYNDGYDAGYSRGKEDMKQSEEYRRAAIVAKAIRTYTGEEDDDAEMPEEPPMIGDEEEIEDIPQLHPEHLKPELISEEQYYDNPWQYDLERMIYYEPDNVLVNQGTPTKPITTKNEMDEVIGVGNIFAFHGDPLHQVDCDSIFVKNDTLGVLFRIDRVDENYGSPVAEAMKDIPDEDEDDFTDEDARHFD